MVQSFRDTMVRSLTTFTFAITLLAGAVAVGVVYNAARITLAERGRELASLRVLGYTRAEVRGLLLGELGALAFLALLPGFALGMGMVALLTRGLQSDLFRVPVATSGAGLAFAALVVLAATVLSGAMVRRRLDRLDLVAALKTKE
jgi:putative ABC transport system permease protein